MQSDTAAARRALAWRLRQEGKLLDEIAAALGVCRERARQLVALEGAAPKESPQRRRDWTAEEDALLGVNSDAFVARRLGVCAAAVRKRRRELGIDRPRGRPRQ